MDGLGDDKRRGNEVKVKERTLLFFVSIITCSGSRIKSGAGDMASVRKGK